MKNFREGFIVPLILGIIIIMLVVGGAWYYLHYKSTTMSPAVSTNPSIPQNTSSGQAASATIPTEVGQCVTTTIATIGTRLQDGVTGADVPGSGSAIQYADGIYQVSYEQVPAVDSSHVGDSVKVCLVSLPENCPPGDDRGKVYGVTNLKTGETWELPDSEHFCGGA